MLLAILLTLTISGCKTIEYVYPEYTFPESPSDMVYSQEDIMFMTINMSEEQKKRFAELLQDFESKQIEWQEWKKAVLEIIKNE